MRQGNPFWWIIRISWPLLGGAWGAWLGFGGYLHLPYHADSSADSFGSFFAMFFFSTFACIGLFAGMATGALVGGLVEKLLRHFGAPMALAVSVATLVNALVLWLVAGQVLASFPGLRGPDAKPPVSAEVQLPRENACAHPPARDSKEYSLWEAECR